MRRTTAFLPPLLLLAPLFADQGSQEHVHGLGQVHMDNSCSPAVSARFDRALALLPAHELYGAMLLELGRPADAIAQFTEALKRTPGRPQAIRGIARAAEVLGDKRTATQRYRELLSIWKHADQDHPDVAAARRSLAEAE